VDWQWVHYNYFHKTGVQLVSPDTQLVSPDTQMVGPDTQLVSPDTHHNSCEGTRAKLSKLHHLLISKFNRKPKFFVYGAFIANSEILYFPAHKTQSEFR
jgi:hypothetical protein